VLIRRLAGLRGAPVVTSLYLDLDGRHLPRISDYTPHVAALGRAARHRAAGLGPAAAEAVEANLERISAWFAAGTDRRNTRGVALFSDAAADLFEVVELPVAVRDHVSLGDRPDVAPLCEARGRCAPALAVVLDRHRARFFHIEGTAVEEVKEADRPPVRRVDTDLELGGWERQHEEQARRHVRGVARELGRHLEARSVEHVVLGGAREAVAALETCLARAVREKVVGTVTMAMTAPAAEVARATAEVLRRARGREQARLLQVVRSGAEQRRGAVTGLEATLGALAEGRVTTLVVDPETHGPGARCAVCGRLTVDAARCPRCGARPAPEDDVVDAAVTEACAAHVDVEVCESRALEDVGGIAGVVRV